MDEKKNNKPNIKKSALYVDVEDDLTTIISKIKSSSGKVIALVPPKRVGILQSAVNLKLLKKTADKQKKDLILVSTDKTLGTLAAGAGIPVARNLTSEPKLLDLPEDFDDEELITGLDNFDRKPEEKSREYAAVEAIADDDKINDGAEGDVIDDEPKRKSKAKKSKKSGGAVIPNIKKFRRWLILGILVLLSLGAFAVWAMFFSTMTITISAKTSEENIDQAVTLEVDGKTVAEESKLRAVAVRDDSDTRQIQFTPTGKKEKGNKASGSIVIRNAASTNYNPDTGAKNVVTIPAGVTVYTAGGLQFVTNEAVTLAKGESASVGATAVAIGPEYNIPAQTAVTVAVSSAVPVTASTKGAFSGGSRETVSVVQQSDINQVVDKIRGDNGNNSNARSAMLKKFADDVVPIEDSFKLDVVDISSNPGVDEEAQSATVSLRLVYTMYGIPKTDINNILSFAANNKLSNKNNQTVFDNGMSGVKIESYNPGNDSLRLVTTAKIGPKVVDDEIKADAVGKKAYEIESSIESINGVEDVTVDMPFWMSVAPEANRIKIVKSGL